MHTVLNYYYCNRSVCGPVASFRKHTFVLLLPLHGHQMIPRFPKVRSRQEVVTTPWPALPGYEEFWSSA